MIYKISDFYVLSYCRSFDLEKALSMLQEELEHLGDGSEMDKMTSISRSSLFLYSMLLLLLGYFIREFKVVFRETSEKKVVSVEGDGGVVEGHVIPVDSIGKLFFYLLVY